MAGMINAALIEINITTTSNIADFDLSEPGSELKIDYLVKNTTQSENLDDAIYRILIPAGINQSIYSVHVPDNWVALVRSDEIELYTLNSYEDILCGETKSFTIYAKNTMTEQAQIQAMTSIGDWAAPVNADIPTGQVPEPTTLLLLASGAYLMKRRN
ncbi:MAG: PEP-CTERM sorting domain-containing protein [Phycisphaerae bacterium]|nr:PEP-CTERM sorting domain-containing protein [Phycisphaerae bacterium]